MRDIYVTNNLGGTKADGQKIDWTLLNFTCLKEVVKVLEFGAKKYGRENYKLVERNRYEKALLRHVISYIFEEKLDPETSLSHLAHAICSCLFLLEKDMENKNGN